MSAAALGIALILIILTPLIWRKLVETIEKVGWISTIIAALSTLLPVSIPNLPTGWKFAPIIIAGIILSLTVYHSRKKSIKIPIKQRWALFTHARRMPDVTMLKAQALQLGEKSTARPSAEDGIYHYENRSQLPFGDVISKAEQKVEMLAITFTIATISNFNTLKGILTRKVHLTFLLLDPDSPSVQTQSEIYHGSEDLKRQIQKSLQILCDLKNKFNDSVDIKLYHSISANSIVIIDREDPDKAWIQVERRPVGSDSNSRPIDVTYRKHNLGFFNEYLKEYEEVLGKSKSYGCPSTTF